MAGTIMYDQKTGKRVNVNDKYVDDYIAKGYATTKPKTTTRNEIIYDADSNQTKYYDSEGVLYRTSRGDKTSNATHSYDSGSGGGGGSSIRSSSSSSSIDDAYKEQMKALRAQIQAGISRAKSPYYSIISQAHQTNQPLRNQVSLSKEQQLQALRESLANQGNRGGTGRQAMLGISTAAENQLGDINLQQQNVIDEANRAIADIEQQGKFQESQLTAELAAQKLRELLAQEQRAGEMAEDTRRWEAEFELRQQAEKDKAADALRKQFIDTIGQYANDYQARINELQNDGDPTNDWQIPYLSTARQGKIDAANAKWQEQGYVSEDIAAALGKPVGTMTQAYKLKLQDAARQAEVQYALKLFEDLGRATPQIAAILARYGLPSDAMTLNALKTQYSINNPNTGGSGGSEKPWYLQ